MALTSLPLMVILQTKLCQHLNSLYLSWRGNFPM